MCFLERKSAPCEGPNLADSLLFFAVTRELAQRKISARLPAPPASLNCREFLSLFPYKSEEYGHFSRFLLGKSDCREGTALAADGIDQAVFSAAGMSSPTCKQLLGATHDRPSGRSGNGSNRNGIVFLTYPSAPSRTGDLYDFLGRPLPTFIFVARETGARRPPQ